MGDYHIVSTIEGGALFAEGVWRPEPISCMNDNRLCFNAPSRVAIVKRIVEIAGTSFPMQGVHRQRLRPFQHAGPY